jgi:hypothetical protein
MTFRALRTRLLLPVVPLALCAASPASAVWPSDPAVNVPVCTAPGGQHNPVSVSDGAGGAIITWQDNRSGTSKDIYAQRIAADGTPQWTADGVALCAASGNQEFPTIAADGSGGAIITWQDGRPGTTIDVYAQRISASGAVQWTANGVPLCSFSGSHLAPTIVSDGAGGAIVTWYDTRSGSGNHDIYAQRISAGAAIQWTANGVALCTATGNQQYPVIVSDGAGGAIVAWEDHRGDLTGIYTQRISAAGATLWTTDGVALCTASDYQSNPRIVSDGSDGAIVTWQDYRSATDYDIYVQRISAGGAVQWMANGVPVCVVAGAQANPAIVADGSGGAIIAWDDWRGPYRDIYAQRISAGGTAQWTANGAALCTATGDQASPSIAPDGAGGAVVAWEDNRSGNYDIFAQRVSTGGVVQWAANGVALCTATGDQTSSAITLNGGAPGETGSGAIVAWRDGRNGGLTDIYAQRVDRWGYLGSQLTITGVHDVPADDGGHVLVDWTRSTLDTLPGLPITAYYLWRQAPRSAAQAALASGARLLADGVPPTDSPRGSFRTSALGGLTYYWEYMGAVTPTGAATYSAPVATPTDSTATGNPRTLLMVEAATSTAGLYWLSDPDSGYSVDNLAPAPPTAFLGTYANGAATLSWDASPAADLAGYRLHRGSTSEFVPDEGNLVATPGGTGCVDAACAPYFYRLAAVDVHGNLSSYTFLQPNGTVGVPGTALPRELALSPPAPNPLRGSCTMRLALPHAAPVSLAVYDQQGRRLRTLLAGAQPSGERTIVWDGRDDGGRPVANALYFVRLETGGRTISRRLVVVR